MRRICAKFVDLLTDGQKEKLNPMNVMIFGNIFLVRGHYRQ